MVDDEGARSESEFTIVYTEQELRDELERMSQEHLHCGWPAAREKLRSGELDGTRLEVDFKMKLYLLGEEL